MRYQTPRRADEKSMIQKAGSHLTSSSVPMQHKRELYKMCDVYEDEGMEYFKLHHEEMCT